MRTINADKLKELLTNDMHLMSRSDLERDRVVGQALALVASCVSQASEPVNAPCSPGALEPCGVFEDPWKIDMQHPIMNENPFEHEGRYGTLLRADRCDFQNGATLVRPPGISDEHFASDLFEIVSWHALRIHPHLNGFQGYDCVFSGPRTTVSSAPNSDTARNYVAMLEEEVGFLKHKLDSIEKCKIAKAEVVQQLIRQVQQHQREIIRVAGLIDSGL